MVPVFGGPQAPPPLRVGLGVLLAVLCLPRLRGSVPALAPALWALLLAREAAVGLTLGFVASLAFRAAESAGHLGDILRGANVAEVLAPGSGERTSRLGGLMLLLSVVIFLGL